MIIWILLILVTALSLWFIPKAMKEARAHEKEIVDTVVSAVNSPHRRVNVETTSINIATHVGNNYQAVRVNVPLFSVLKFIDLLDTAGYYMQKALNHAVETYNFGNMTLLLTSADGEKVSISFQADRRPITNFVHRENFNIEHWTEERLPGESEEQILVGTDLTICFGYDCENSCSLQLVRDIRQAAVNSFLENKKIVLKGGPEIIRLQNLVLDAEGNIRVFEQAFKSKQSEPEILNLSYPKIKFEDKEYLPYEMIRALAQSLKGERVNIAVTGEQGTGKTSLVGIILSEFIKFNPDLNLIRLDARTLRELSSSATLVNYLSSQDEQQFVLVIDEAQSFTSEEMTHLYQIADGLLSMDNVSVIVAALEIDAVFSREGRTHLKIECGKISPEVCRIMDGLSGKKRVKELGTEPISLAQWYDGLEKEGLNAKLRANLTKS
jgi:hypothetical protein